MKIKREIKRKYIMEFEFDEEELRILRCTLGMTNLPEIVMKCYGEFDDETLTKLFKEIKEGLNDGGKK